MKTLIITILFTHVFAQNNSDTDYKMNSIIDGMYEIVSWWDGKILYTPPAVSGRMVLYNGKIISVIHNRIDSNNHKSAVKWGEGAVKDGKFRYQYSESINVATNYKSPTVNNLLPFTGVRIFNAELIEGDVVLQTESKRQKWIISKKGMDYTDEAWGDEKIFVRRTWKRITPLKEEILND